MTEDLMTAAERYEVERCPSRFTTMYRHQKGFVELRCEAKVATPHDVHVCVMYIGPERNVFRWNDAGEQVEL